MGINKFEIIDYHNNSGVVLGGTPYLESIMDWPLIPNTEQKQTLLLTIFPSYFKIPTIAEDQCISIFISRDNASSYNEKFSYHSTSDASSAKGYSRVLIHKRASSKIEDTEASNILPIYSLAERGFSQEEFERDTLGVTKGSELSKNGGRPGWLQDVVFFGPKYYFEMQLNEYLLRKKNLAYDNIFNDGIGYLYLNHNIKKLKTTSESGLFFIQYT